MINQTEQISLIIMTFIIMVGMGATLRTADFQQATAQPKAFLIGMLCQFGLMPAIAFALGWFFALPPLVALSLLLIGATPGGTTSNLFTYLVKGNLALSITMTVCSTLMAIALMPLMITLWAAGINELDLKVPYENIFTVLVILISGVSLGMYLRSFGEKAGRITETIGAGVGILFIAALVFFWFQRNASGLGNYPLGYFFAAGLLLLMGFLLGNLLSRGAGLPARDRRAVFLETGIQNTPLTIAVIVLSYPTVFHEEMLIMPAFYAILLVLLSIVVTIFTRAMVNRNPTGSVESRRPIGR